MAGLSPFPHRNHDYLLERRKNGYLANGKDTTWLLRPGKGRRLPFGSMARTLLMEITTSACRQQKRGPITLANSMRDFFRKDTIGNICGTSHKLLKEILDSFRNTEVYLRTVSVNPALEESVTEIKGYFLEDYSNDENGIRVTLSKWFYAEVVSNPVSVPLNSWMAVKGKSRAIDLLVWLCDKSKAPPGKHSWKDIRCMFQAQDINAESLKRQLTKALDHLNLSYYKRRVTIEYGGLRIDS